jgi:hypothetical protein
MYAINLHYIFCFLANQTKRGLEKRSILWL